MFKIFNKKNNNDFYEWTQEDYRKLMLRSSPCQGEEYLKPLIDTDPEKWAQLFDATRVREPEPNYLLANIITFLFAIISILFYHFY